MSPGEYTLKFYKIYRLVDKNVVKTEMLGVGAFTVTEQRNYKINTAKRTIVYILKRDIITKRVFILTRLLSG